MATKKSNTKPKSRTSNKNSSQLTQFKFRWWMALLLVGIVAIIGIVIIRSSFAYPGAGGGPRAARINSNYYGVLAVQYYDSGNLTSQTDVLTPIGGGNYRAQNGAGAIVTPGTKCGTNTGCVINVQLIY